MKTALIIGAGAGGAAAAKELQGKCHVTVIEAGGVFRPFRVNISILQNLRSTNLFFSEKMIQMILPAFRISKTRDGMVLVHGSGIGGTTTLSCGNALRADSGLKKIGINLDEEFEELRREIPITSDHRHLWKKQTRKLYEICKREGLSPFAVPKMGNYKKCRNCGNCTLGCRYGIKWDASEFIRKASGSGAEIITKCRAERICFTGSRAAGIITNRGFMPADIIIVAAGGLNTPVILENSGIHVKETLFVDPVLCVAAEHRDTFQDRELPMPFAVQMDRYIISPYFDRLSFFFNKRWRYPATDIVSLMIKLSDSETGSPGNKVLTGEDMHRLEQGVEQCRRILTLFGIRPEKTFLGTVNAGHPGGMFPLSAREAATFHDERLPDNVYVADASLIPASSGKPPILTIMALAKRISRIILERHIDL